MGFRLSPRTTASLIHVFDIVHFEFTYTIISNICLSFFTETEEEIAAPLYLNENHLNNRIARSIDPYSYYWNDLKRGDPSHLLRFAKRSGGMDDHMLRFAKKSGDDHFLRFAKSGMDDHMLRFAKKSAGDDHFLRFAKGGMDDHMLRFAKSGMDDHMLRFAKKNSMDNHFLRFARNYNDHMLRFAKSGMDDHMLRFAKKDDPEMAEQAIEETDGGKMDLAKRWYYTRGARGQMNDHMLRFA